MLSATVPPVISLIAPRMLETPRLRLRALQIGDSAHLFELLSDPEVMKYVAFGRPWTLQEVDDYIERKQQAWRHDGFGIYLVFDRKTLAFVGRAGLQKWDSSGRVELGFAFMKRSWGTGLATEVAEKLVELAIEKLQMDSVYGTVRLENAPSQRVLEKIGMKQIGIEAYLNEPAFVFRRTAIEYPGL